MSHPKYIYCIIQTSDEHDFGPIGLNEERVYTIKCGKLAAVVSDSQEEEYSLADETHVKAHEAVLEETMEKFEMLPIRFGTVAPGTHEVIGFIKQHHRDFKRLIKKLKGRVEIEIEVFWKEMDQVFAEIVEESQRLKKLKSSGKPRSREDLIMAGQLVGAKLRAKKEKETLKYLRYIKGTYADFRINPTAKDELIMYASFLVDRRGQGKFDDAVDNLEAENCDRVRVRYIGPLPPYSFANVIIRES